MTICWDFYRDVRELKISDQRAEEIAQIAAKYMTPNYKVEKQIQETVAEKEAEIAELKAKLEEQEKLLANPNLQMERLIEKVVCEHLCLNQKSEAYSGRYVQLCWGNKELDEVCIQSYSDD